MLKEICIIMFLNKGNIDWSTLKCYTDELTNNQTFPSSQSFHTYAGRFSQREESCLKTVSRPQLCPKVL